MVLVRPQAQALKDPFPWGLHLTKLASGQAEWGRSWKDLISVLSLGELARGTGPLENVPMVKWYEYPSSDISLTRNIDMYFKELQVMGIRLNNPDEIEEYLLELPDMIEATVQIATVVCESLSDAQLTLEVYRDPEIDDKHLVLYARFKNYDQLVMKKIRNVREKIRGHLVGKRGWLHVTTDFHPVE